MKDRKYEQFVNRWKDVTDLPKQQIGPLTPLYHQLVKPFKTMPGPVIFIIGSLIAIGLFFLFGSAIVRLVSILQQGF